MKLKILLLTFLFITAVASQADAPLYDTLEEMRTRLINMTKEIINLHIEVKNWKEIASKSIEENRNHVVSNTIIQFFRDVGYSDAANPYARDPQHLQQVFRYAVKYKSLLTPEAVEVCRKGNIVPEVFLMIWIAGETHFNPLVECHNKDKYGRVISIDRNLTQINSGSRYDKKTDLWYYTTEAWDFFFAKLPVELKNKKCNPHNDVEIGVAMFYLWVNDRVKMKMPFAYANWGWTLYAIINKTLEKYDLKEEKNDM